jgi:glycine betaine/proline transport system permease protein
MATITVPVTARSPRSGTIRRWLPLGVTLLVIGVVGIALGKTPPTWLDAHVRPWADGVYKWAVKNRQSAPIFRWFFTPIADALRSCYDATVWLLRAIRWPGVLAVFALIGWRLGGPRTAAVGVLTMAACGLLGAWDDTMITLALMIVSVVLSLAVGVPLGIACALNDRVEGAVRAVLDTTQVLPAFVYMLPLTILFGISFPPAIVATMIFAIAPAVRLTNHGVRSVPAVATEVGTSFGSTRRQLLTKVQLPMARRAILLGLNQVIMMAFGVVVLAALLGTGGLGQNVKSALDRVNVGKAFMPGLALVFCAIALDRVASGERARGRPSRFAAVLGRPWWQQLGAGAAVVAAAAVAAAAAGIGREFPSWSRVDLTGTVNRAATWSNTHLRSGIPVVGGTNAFSNVLVRDILNPVRDVFLHAPWWLVIALVVLVAWLSGGRRLALACGLCMTGIAALRVWSLAMETLSQVLVIVLLSVALAVPIGIWAGRSDRVERALRPVLDIAQVMPAFVYLVPVIFLFNVGRVPGIVASVIYAVPPGIRLTSLGMRQVPVGPREAALSFGATPRQELFKVQLPLAAKSVMLGINQTIIMVLSMVVIAALVGAGALGLETVYGLTKSEIGRGVAGGLAIVLLAVVLDRITQAWGGAGRQAQPSGIKRGENT